MIRNIFIIVSFFLLLPGCAYFIRPKGMTRAYSGEYTGLDTLINIDGYYTTIEYKKYESDTNTIWQRGIMFYTDGLVNYPERHIYRPHRIVEGFVTNKKTGRMNINWAGWGVYHISGDTIRIKNTNWYDIFTPLETRDTEFLILNKNEIKQINGWYIEPDKSFHFVPYPNRVDSTNWLLKRRWFRKKKK